MVRRVGRWKSAACALLGASGLLGPACSAESKQKCQGAETCACYEDERCNEGLKCLSGLCVDPNGGEPGGGGTSNAGTGQGGSDASAGAVTDAGAGGDDSGNAGTSPGGRGSGGTGSGGAANAGSAGCGTSCTERGTPTVLILIDNSSSMFEPRESGWDVAFQGLVGAMGPIEELQTRIRFGFASYKGAALGTTEENPQCADIRSVDFALDNYDAILDTYTDLGTEWMVGVKWETPTGHAIRRATAQLLDDTAAPPGPKSILLVTDGNPNTCAVLDPQCGQDRVIEAVQAAFQQGVRTYAVGIGDIVTSPTGGCTPAYMRCGADHLQDVANAGIGQPVILPPADYIYQGCATADGRRLFGTYAPAGGSAQFYLPGTADELRTNVRAVLDKILADAQ